MTEHFILVTPVVQQVAEQPHEVVGQHIQQRLTTEDEIRAADHLFANQQKEQQLVSALLGMYTGSLLLHDLAADHLSHDDDEEREKLLPLKE